MVEIINNYETVFIVNPDLDEEKTEAVVAKIKTLIESAGTIDSVDVWGKRKLAYEINDKSEGYYVLVNFSSKSDFPAELDRIYKITEDIMRSIIIKKNKFYHEVKNHEQSHFGRQTHCRSGIKVHTERR